MVTEQPEIIPLQVNGGQPAQAARTRFPEAIEAIKILAAHSAPVMGVAAGTVDGEPILVSGGYDAIVRLWNPLTGEPIGSPLAGHNGWVRSVAVDQANGICLVVSGGYDGRVHRWNAANGKVIGEPLVAHQGPLRSVAIGHAGRRSVIVSAGNDAIVRRWDAITGEEIGTPLGGHTDRIQALAFADIDGEGVIFSAGHDGTVRRWNASTGAPIGEPMRRHEGAVRALASGFRRGVPVIVSAGFDKVIRVWDAATGGLLPLELAGHQDRVQGLAAAQLEENSVVVSGGYDSSVRTWDLDTGAPIGAPIRVHSDWVWSVAVLQTAAGSAAVSGSDDGSIVIWPITGESEPPDIKVRELVAVAGQPVSETGVSGATPATATIDSVLVEDQLGREVLAAHIIGIYEQLATHQRHDVVVVHVDGPWGAGKSTLVQLICRRLQKPDQRVNRFAKAPAPEMQMPIVIEYDAWRESIVAPDWWSLSAALNRSVRQSRAWSARAAMTAIGSLGRFKRSPAAISALVLLIVTASLLATGKLGGGVKTVATAVTALSAIIALSTTFSRALFWSSSAFGRLHLRTEENPLGAVIALIGWLRRWSPRLAAAQRRADSATGLLAVLLTIWLAAGFIMSHEWEGGWSTRYAAMGGAAAAFGCGVWFVVRHYRPMPSFHMVTIGGAAASFACAVWIPRWVPLWEPLVLLTALAVGHTTWSKRLAIRHARRPLLLVVDELDRCEADRVAQLLRSVHTLMRAPARTSFLSCWRSPAPLLVLVLADGEWLRIAFTETYKHFSDVDRPTRIGGDFLNKVFDHCVLVPELSLDQTKKMIDLATRYSPGTADPPSADGAIAKRSVDARNRVASALEAAGAQGHRGATLQDAIDDPDLDYQDRVAAEVSRVQAEATDAASESRARHLLARYHDLLPPNPRLIKRIANAWGMLLAVQSSTGHDESLDTIARAAILWVGYPEVRTALAKDAGRANATELSTRLAESDPRLRRLLTRPDGSRVSLDSIARCYGKNSAPIDAQAFLDAGL
jgi:WD40 repeat protein